MLKLTGSHFLIAALVYCGLAVFPSSAEGKDLTNRLGIGYINQFSSQAPALAVQYYPSMDLGLSAALAVDTERDNSSFGIMAKLYRIVFQEENLNFYMGAGVGLVSQESPGETQSGFELMGFMGSEFFFSGLENLGFRFEAGVGVTSLASGVRFRTFGDRSLRAGIIFYF
jgi:hypothetical protein